MRFEIFRDEASKPTEARILSTRFRAELARMEFRECPELPDQIGKIAERRGFITWLPYWLTDIMQKKVPLNVIRTMSLGNLFGLAYVVSLDRIVDAQNEVLNAVGIRSDELVVVSTMLYHRLVREYQKVFPNGNVFWALFEKYLHEYIKSCLWEMKEHKQSIQEFHEQDLIYLGRKAALTKVCAAAICLLEDKVDWVPQLSHMLDSFLTGYQLADDVQDWKEDLKRNNFTYFLTELNKKAALSTTAEVAMEEIIRSTNVMESVLAKSTAFYEQARSTSEELGCAQFSFHLDNLVLMNKRLISAVKGGEYQFAGEQNKPLTSANANFARIESHAFVNRNKCYVFEVNGSRSLNVDQLAFRVLAEFDTVRSRSVDALCSAVKETPRTNVRKAIGELVTSNLLIKDGPSVDVLSDDTWGDLGLDRARNNGLKGLAIETARQGDDTELMSPEIAKKAVHFLFRLLRGSTGGSIFFFNCRLRGRPERNLISRTMSLALKLSQKLSVPVTGSIQCGIAALTNSCSLDFLGSTELGSITFLSTPGDIVNADESEMREGVQRLKTLGKRVRAILQVPSDMSVACGHVLAISKLGLHDVLVEPANEEFDSEFQKIITALMSEWREKGHYNLANANRILERLGGHQKHHFFCGAGKAYAAVSVDGTIFPCHKLVGRHKFAMGSVVQGIDEVQKQFLSLSVDTDARCACCWARYVCGGGCLFLKSSVRGRCHSNEADPWCDVYRRHIEQIIADESERGEGEAIFDSGQADFDCRPCDMS